MAQPIRVAVMGYRHGHINTLIAQVKASEDAVLVAACEEDPRARAAMVDAGVTELPFEDYTDLLDTVECDIIAVGDYYGKRGGVVLEALRRGKHVISDKPLCTSLDEQDAIEARVRETGLSVGCQFDMRYNGLFRTLRRLIREGVLGEVHAIGFEGQHPLMYGQRAGWYFEEGKHGGTINDIAIHACDYLPWLTGLRIVTVNAARNWNARLKEVPHFKDAAQLMLTMDNGCGILGDVSYLTPDSFGYGLPQYHRTIVWGAGGMAEVSVTVPAISLYRDGKAAVQLIPPDPVPVGNLFTTFLDEIRGLPNPELTTREVLHASRTALTIQNAADMGLTNVPVGESK